MNLASVLTSDTPSSSSTPTPVSVSSRNEGVGEGREFGQDRKGQDETSQDGTAQDVIDQDVADQDGIENITGLFPASLRFYHSVTSIHRYLRIYK